VQLASERLHAFAAQISPDSHDPEVRRAFGKARYNNDDLERAIQHLLATECKAVDLFFMIGLPGQTRGSVRESVGYASALLQRFDRRLSAFITPLGPFLDPGSSVFERPEAFGYVRFTRTLAEHSELWESRDWEHLLSYERKWMTRRDIVDATYEAAWTLNRAKAETGRITKERVARVESRLARAARIQAALDAAGDGPLDAATHAELLSEIRLFFEATLLDKAELFPPRAFLANFRIGGILRALVPRARSSSVLSSPHHDPV
jgi:radical SAM superfamily enzyme YgiQ (UPF0313 family)